VTKSLPKIERAVTLVML